MPSKGQRAKREKNGHLKAHKKRDGSYAATREITRLLDQIQKEKK